MFIRTLLEMLAQLKTKIWKEKLDKGSLQEMLQHLKKSGECQICPENHFHTI